MKRKACIILFIVIMAGFLPSLTHSVSAQNGESVKIHTVGESIRTRFDKQVLVAGIWHYFNVTIDNEDFQKLSLKFFTGESIVDEEDRDETNYYEWQYNKDNEPPWIDVKNYGGREYINTTLSTKNETSYNFCIGIKDTFQSQPTFSHKNWTLEVYSDENKIHTETVVVEKPYIGIAKTHGDIIVFNIDPFTNMDALGHDYLRIENRGNIPLNVTVDYASHKDILEFVDYYKISPYSSGTFDGLVIHSKAWPPGKMDISGVVNGEVASSYIIPVATLTFGTSLGIDAPILRIVSAHANYELIEEFPGDITFQYLKTLQMNEGEIKNITTYISGDGNIKFDVRSENITILKVFSQYEEVNTPFFISSTNTSEHIVNIRIEAIKETSRANLHYIIEVAGEIYEYDTKITINPPQTSQGETIALDFLLTIIIAGIIFLVIGYMITTHLKYSRR